jgi:hypothetical protein
MSTELCWRHPLSKSWVAFECLHYQPVENSSVVALRKAGYMFEPFLRRLFADKSRTELILQKGREYMDNTNTVPRRVVIPCCNEIRSVTNPVIELAPSEPLGFSYSTGAQNRLVETTAARSCSKVSHSVSYIRSHICGLGRG